MTVVDRLLERSAKKASFESDAWWVEGNDLCGLLPVPTAEYHSKVTAIKLTPDCTASHFISPSPSPLSLHVFRRTSSLHLIDRASSVSFHHAKMLVAVPPRTRPFKYLGVRAACFHRWLRTLPLGVGWMGRESRVWGAFLFRFCEAVKIRTNFLELGTR